MKKLFTLLLVCAVSFAQAQAQQPEKPDRAAIEVTVAGGKPFVKEYYAVTVEEEGGLRWLAPAGYRFPKDGIYFVRAEGKRKHRCEPADAEGLEFRCKKMAHVRRASDEYKVKLVDAGTGKALPILDPFIVSN